nr:SDR family oxidoreductase [Streptomyces canus]
MSDTKVVVVTGASDGIGAAAARKLHADGQTVVVVGRSAEKTRTVAAEIGADSFVADFDSTTSSVSLPNCAPHTPGSTCSPTTPEVCSAPGPRPWTASRRPSRSTTSRRTC